MHSFLLPSFLWPIYCYVHHQPVTEADQSYWSILHCNLQKNVDINNMGKKEKARKTSTSSSSASEEDDIEYTVERVVDKREVNGKVSWTNHEHNLKSPNFWSIAFSTLNLQVTRATGKIQLNCCFILSVIRSNICWNGEIIPTVITLGNQKRIWNAMSLSENSKKI